MTSHRYERPALEADGNDSLSLLAGQIPPGARVLDLGLGSGALGAFLGARGCTVDGVDLDAHSVEAARPVYHEVKRADLEADLPHELFSGPYDVVVCADVLEHLREPERVLRDLQSILSQDGQVLVSVPNVTYLGAMVELLGGTLSYRDLGLFDRTHVRFFSRANLEELLTSAGLHPFRWSRVVRPLESTEFAATSPGFLPRSTLGFLESQPEALTYQFVVAASPRSKPVAVEALPTPARAASRKKVRLYWRAGAETGYSEEHSSTADAPLLSGHATFLLPIGAREPIRSLRLDPGDDPGVLAIHSLRLSRPGSQDWAWPDPADTALRPLHDLLSLPSHFPGLYLSTGEDPQLELGASDVPGPLLAGKLEVRMSWWAGLPWDLLEDVLDQQRVRELVKQQQERLRTLEGALDGVHRRLGELPRFDAAQLEGRLHRMERLADAQQTATGELQRRLENSSRAAESAIRRVNERLEAGLRLVEHRLQVLSEPAVIRWKRRMGREVRQLSESLTSSRIASGPEVRLRPKPYEGVESRGGGEWYALNDDPQLLLEHRGELPWGECTLSATLEGGDLAPTLYFDFGTGFLPGAEVPLAKPEAGHLTARFHIPRGTVRLRLDPAERSGAFILRSVRLIPSPYASKVMKLYRGPRGVAGRASEPSDEYLRWRSEFVELDGARVAWFASQASRLQGFSPDVLLSADDGDEKALTRTLQTLGAQRFVRPTLCFATSSGRWSEARVQDLAGPVELRFIRAHANRRGLVFRALELARSRHVLLPGRAELLTHALAAIAAHLSRAPGAELLYWDEERWTASGELEPVLKPRWSPSLLEARNYIGDCFVLAGSIAKEFLASQDSENQDSSDVLLRAFRSSPRASETAHHLPAVLARRAQTEDAYRGQQASTRPPPTPRPGRRSRSVVVIVPTRDRLELLRKCVDSLMRQTAYPSFELLIVDNASTEPATLDYLERIRRQERVRVMRDERPFNFAQLNNAAVAECSSDLVCLMNNDVEVTSADWLSDLAGLLEDPEVGAVGPMLLYPDGKVQHAGVVTGMYGVAAHLHCGAHPDSTENNQRLIHPCEVNALTAACVLIPTGLYRSVGGMNAEHLAVAFNDVDLCLKLRQRGRRLLWAPHVRLIHHESVTRGSDDAPERRERLGKEIQYMLRTWGRELPADPYFNPNLSLQSSQPVRLAFPPRTEMPWPRAQTRGDE